MKKLLKKTKRTGTAAFAERELREAGLFDKDSDYNGMIGDAVLELMDVFSKQGHSGFSASLTRELFNQLSNWKPINPLKNPTVTKEYMVVDKEMWQSTKDSSVFSMNQGKSWYSIDVKPTLFEKILRWIHFHINNPLFKIGLISNNFRNWFWEKSHRNIKFDN